MQVSQPKSFAATVVLASTNNPADAGSPEIDLFGILRVDSYSFHNDLLSLWSHAKDVYDLHLRDATVNHFVVQQNAGKVSVIGIDNSANPPPGLPIHV